MMYSVYLLLFILTLRTDGFTLGDVQCNYVFEQKCRGDASNYNLVTYDSSVINYCSVEDVPAEINFTVIPAEGGEWTDFLRIDFEAPKTECGYGVALLVEPSIKDERECLRYKFEKAEDISRKIHTIERSLCVLANNSNQLVRYNDNSTASLCKDNISLEFYYIFTGCYALRFHIGRQRYIIRGHTFLNTTYKRVEVAEPEFTCKYDVYRTFDQRHEITNFTLDASLSADTGLLLKVGLISDPNKTAPCTWGEKPMRMWKVDLEASENPNCNINMMRGNGKTVQCNYQVQNIQTASYCFVLFVIDERCHENTIWKPPMSSPVNKNITCTWLKRCTRTFEDSQHVETVTKSTKTQHTSSYLLLPIIAIVLVVLVIVVTLYFMHYLRIRNEGVNLYVNPQQDDFTNPSCLKSVDFDIVENNDNEKVIDRDNLTYDDIVLLYTKSSVSFMAMMKDFREMLTKMCSCTVHDWHDGAEWNDVARVGAVLWFTELLDSGCRVIWIDMPATRSVVISNPRASDTNLNKLSKYEIGDFRDVAFPVVLESAKRNMKDLMFQYRKHFVVRFEGLESLENLNDPFLELSPHARYLMPQHFAQLCSDLSATKPAGTRYEMKAEEDLLQQRLKFIKMESIM
ncbi:PREDICTED: uncharacterized protein LOC106747399 [Dinoponera quadriceps]|uniref:Uncharacterized protein LOC106747399 n=1 Tax=Dinoponera quadriceps TaxID=609295 RepID=A0A6P3XR16_DINQU|nr:PREDICTED: uncharacterized protein LOC106747399 [Dinoponera quadriceps]